MADEPDDEPDYDLCPKSASGQHSLDPESVTAPSGYDPEAEGGVVLEVRCDRCGRAGALLARAEDVAW